MNHWITLPDRCLLSLRGDHAKEFLQGLMTQDAMLLSKGAIFSALLTPQGFFHSDFFVVPYGDRLYIDCHISHKEALLKTLCLYAPLHQVTVEEATKDFAICVAIGDNIKTLDPKWTQPFTHEDDGWIWFHDPRHEGMGLRALVPYQALHTLPHALLVPHLPSAYHAHRLRHGIAEGAYDLLPLKSVILEYGYDDMGALCWDKGCYMGQELMARTHHRGEIRKGVYICKTLEPCTLPPVGASLMHQEKKVGVMGSHQDGLFLACLYTEKAKALRDTFVLEHDGGALQAQHFS